MVRFALLTVLPLRLQNIPVLAVMNKHAFVASMLVAFYASVCRGHNTYVRAQSTGAGHATVLVRTT